MDFESISTVNWYPGHMRKAEREIREKLKLIDVVVELVDARAPLSSQNVFLEEQIKHKARLLVLTKSDLAEPEITDAWLERFRSEGLPCTSLHHRQKNVVQKLSKLMVRAADEDRKRRGATTPRLHAVRGIILGLPNVGKSSLINSMVKKKQTKTGPTPGVTRHQQWVKLGKDLELLDTPGVMAPRVSDPETGLKLGVIATIKDSVVGEELMCDYLLHVWDKFDRLEFMKRYQLQDFPVNVQDMIDRVGRSGGFLKVGNEVEQKQVCLTILRDYREGKFGPMSLECPSDFQNEPGAE